MLCFFSALFITAFTFAYPPQGTGAVWKNFLKFDISPYETIKVYVDDDPARVIGETFQDHIAHYGNLRLPFFFEYLNGSNSSLTEKMSVEGWSFSYFKLDPLSGLSFNLSLIFLAPNRDLVKISMDVSQSLLGNIKYVRHLTGGTFLNPNLLSARYFVTLDSSGYLKGLLGQNSAFAPRPLAGTPARMKTSVTVKPSFEKMTPLSAIQELNLLTRRREVDRVYFESFSKLPRGVEVSQVALEKIKTARAEFLKSIIPHSQYQNVQASDALRVMREAYVDAKTGHLLGVVVAFEVKPELQHHFKKMESLSQAYLIRGEELEAIPPQGCQSNMDKLLG